MKAIVQDRYGSTDALHLEDIDPPAIGDRDVLIRVHAAGVDPGTWHLMAGLPLLARSAIGLRRPKDRVRGLDVAGTVEAIGSAVTRFGPGDEVFGTCRGAFAELAAADEDRIAPKPAGLSFVEAAAIPVSGITAVEAVRKARVTVDQRVLVIGAGGGVGTFAVQVAAAAGAEVTGLCSSAKADLVRAIGAVDVVDYTRHDLPEAIDATGTFDVVIDTAGHRALKVLRRALGPKGTLVIVGSEGGGRWLGGIDRSGRAALLSPFVGQRLCGLVGGQGREELEELARLVDAGLLVPVIDRTYPLVGAAAAVDHVHDGHAAGKVVLTVA